MGIFTHIIGSAQIIRKIRTVKIFVVIVLSILYIIVADFSSNSPDFFNKGVLHFCFLDFIQSITPIIPIAKKPIANIRVAVHFSIVSPLMAMII